MARSHGRILTCIWEDKDFLGLTEQQQRMYLFLISQPNLNHAGLLPLTLRRWARKAAGLTTAELNTHLQALADARFIVIDEDTEELLIRTFVRNDGVWRMPNVMGAMVSDAQEISSSKLRRTLLEEMDRLPLDVLSDEPPKRGGPSARVQVERHLANLRELWWDPTQNPPRRVTQTLPQTPPEESKNGISGSHGNSNGARNEASAENTEGGEEEPQASGFEEGDENGSGNPSGTLYAHVRAFSPSPTPTTNHNPRERTVVDVEAARADPAEHQRPDDRPPLHELPDDFALTDAMRRWAQQTYPQVDVDHETQKFIWHWRSEGRRKRNWYEAWKRWISDANQYLIKHGTSAALPVAAGAENVVHLPAGQPLRGTDARVAGWLNLPTEV